jgi:TP901 family phage tail tape measure protein
VNFVSSITLQFRDLFSQGMAQARSSVTQLQSSLNDINPAGLADLSASAVAIPAPDIGQPVIPIPDSPGIDIPTPEIGQPVIPTPNIPPMDELEEMLGGSVAHLGGMSEALEGIGKGFDGITPKVGMFDKGLEHIKNGLDKIEQNSSLNMVATQLSVMANMTAPLRNSLAAMMGEPSKLAGSFESSLKNIQAITGNTNEEMAALNQQLLAIGKNAVAGPQGVVDAMNDIAGGVDNAESHLGILNGAILLAEAGQADLGVAANGLVSIMNAYSLASGDAASATENAVTVSDVLTQTVGQGVGSMEAFIGAFSQVSGLSASVGVGFDEVGAALAFITTQGPAASEAATQLKAAETSLLNPNETLSKALQSIGIESGSAMLAEYGLVESLRIVKQSVGGSQDSMAKALGSTMALNGATALLGSGYTDFAAKFGTALESGVTAEAAAVQNRSYESKLARMEAASEVLKLQIGADINAIKGFFVDMGAGFLSHVASPILSSPVGGVFRGIAAGSGIVLQGILSFGSGALTTAAQFSVLAANIKNAGGYIEMFKGVMSLAGAPFKTLGGMVSSFITSLFGIGAASATAAGGTTAMGVASGAAAAPIGTAATATGGLGVALHSVSWPILAIVAGVAALAVGSYFLVKNWNSVAAFFVNLWNTITGVFSGAFNWIRNKLAGMSDWVLGAAAVFMPFIGIPALIIKHWDTIAAFFAGLWIRITGWTVSAWEGIKTFFASLWTGITATFVQAWNGIVSVVATVANWFTGVWNTVTGAFAAVWAGVSDLFRSIWTGIKDVVLGFVEWLSPVIDMIIAPFKAVGNVIGGIIGTVKDWFGETVDMGNEAVGNMRAGLAEDTAPRTVNTATATVAGDASPATAAPESIAIPNFASTGTAVAVPAQHIAPQAVTATTSSSSLAMEHLEAARRKGVSASDISSIAASAFENAGAYTPPASTPFLEPLPAAVTPPMVDVPDIDREARVTFAEAMPPQRQSVMANAERESAADGTPRQNIFHITNMNFNADELRTLLDIVRQLELAVAEPEAV